jgi:hypothetical protein
MVGCRNFGTVTDHKSPSYAKKHISSGASLQTRALNIIPQMPFKTIERL